MFYKLGLRKCGKSFFVNHEFRQCKNMVLKFAIPIFLLGNFSVNSIWATIGLLFRQKRVNHIHTGACLQEGNAVACVLASSTLHPVMITWVCWIMLLLIHTQCSTFSQYLVTGWYFTLLCRTSTWKYYHTAWDKALDHVVEYFEQKNVELRKILLTLRFVRSQGSAPSLQ